MTLPWTRQGRHERWLAKNGQAYKYGSYAFSAADLCAASQLDLLLMLTAHRQRDGILLSINHSMGVDFKSIELVLSCKEEGVFEVQAKVLGLAVASSVLQWEDLVRSPRERGLLMIDGAHSSTLASMALVRSISTIWRKSSASRSAHSAVQVV